MRFKTKDELILCVTDSGYLSFILEANGEIAGSSDKGAAHCSHYDLIDLGKEIGRLMKAKEQDDVITA